MQFIGSSCGHRGGARPALGHRLALTLFTLTLAFVSHSAFAAPTFTVNSVVDAAAGAPLDNGVCETAPGNGVCTLRAAIMKANHFPGGGVTINLPANTYSLTIAPSGANDEATGDLNITASVTINGASATTTIVDANKIDGVITIATGPTVVISNLTIRNGMGKSTGGGISNSGGLTLSGVVISNNQSGMGSAGGGFANLGSAATTLNNTVITGNRGGGNAGGIYNGSNLTLNNCSVTSNMTLDGGYGGGILSAGTLVLNKCLVSNNQTTPQAGNPGSGSGGGIAVLSGVLTAVNSTISNNSAYSNGGGIYNNGTVNTFFVTIAGNLADSHTVAAGSGGGVANVGGSVNIRTTIIAQNYVGPISNDATGALFSKDYNLIQNMTGVTITGATTHNLTGDPALESLQSNGGPTLTRAPFIGSPALNAVPLAQCTDQVGAPLTVDQRGSSRPSAAGCDIGAYEGSLATPFYGRNLVRNGDADSSAGSPIGAFVGVPYWSVTGGHLTTVPYNAPGGFPNLATDMVPAIPGYNFFAGGNAGNSSVDQKIDVSAIATDVDTGTVRYSVSGDFGGFSSQDDNAELIVFFLDNNGKLLPASATLGPVSASDRGNRTGFLNKRVVSTVPSGARTIGLDLLTEVTTGFNDGYADNLALILGSPATLGNISTRGNVQTGDQVMIGGFIVSGPAGSTQKVLIRAIGPSLAQFGVPGTLNDPTLGLFDSAGKAIARNDNWQTTVVDGTIITGDQVMEIQNTGKAPNSPNESAIIATLPPGDYTAIVQGVGGTTGIGLVEVYALSSPPGTTLSNISTRGNVQTQDKVMIGGFIIDGPNSTTQKVLIRAIGPSLAQFGVPTPLNDPTLALFNSAGTRIATNDNWQTTVVDGTVITGDQVSDINNTGKPPSSPSEAAIIATLPPGNYTAIVQGVGGTTGNALVEIYALTEGL